jgi:hypothetical protein
MFERVLGAAVRREEACASGLFCATFCIDDSPELHD